MTYQLLFEDANGYIYSMFVGTDEIIDTIICCEQDGWKFVELCPA